MANEDCLKIQLSSDHVKTLTARINEFKSKLEGCRTRIEGLTTLGNPPALNSGVATKANLEDDARQIHDVLEKYIAYLDDVYAMVHGDGQRLLSS